MCAGKSWLTWSWLGNLIAEKVLENVFNFARLIWNVEGRYLSQTFGSFGITQLVYIGIDRVKSWWFRCVVSTAAILPLKWSSELYSIVIFCLQTEPDIYYLKIRLVCLGTLGFNRSECLWMGRTQEKPHVTVALNKWRTGMLHRGYATGLTQTGLADGELFMFAGRTVHA
jgi:hypothetical protein